MSPIDVQLEDVEIVIEPPESIDVVTSPSTDIVVLVPQNIGLPGPMDPGLPNHIINEDPHPVYDDGTSFILRYENAKV